MCVYVLCSQSLTSDSLQPAGSSVHGIPQARILGGLPCPPPGDLPDPGIEPASPALKGGFSTTEPPREPSGYEKNVLRLSSFLLAHDARFEAEC